ncbi:MAG: hypothetical protein H6719_14050 [Sandaracinaceae bacterium]|nr:hypothetical protein [Sandaracinaceae bacterium]
MARRLVVFAFATLLLGACGGDGSPDAGFDASPDVDAGGPPDAGFDAGADAGSDAGPLDAGSDAGALDAGGATTTFPPRDLRCMAGTTPPCATTEPTRSDAERTVVVPRDMAPGTYTYVIRTWSMPEASFAGTAAGFNLDGLDSGSGSTALDANCEELGLDYHSLRDPSHVGIDNAMSSLVTTIEGLLDAATCPGMVVDGCLDATFARGIAEGTFLVLLELTGVESFEHDDDVQVALYVGAVPGGGAPTLEADGRIAAGQAFDTVRELTPPTTGDIFEGRLRVRWPDTLVLPGSAGVLLPLQLDAPELRGTVDATQIGLGVVGASTEVDFLVAQAEAAMPGIGGTVRSVLESIADFEPTTDPFICARVSSGYFFDAVSASRR